MRENGLALQLYREVPSTSRNGTFALKSYGETQNSWTPMNTSNIPQKNRSTSIPEGTVNVFDGAGDGLISGTGDNSVRVPDGTAISDYKGLTARDYTRHQESLVKGGGSTKKPEGSLALGWAKVGVDIAESLLAYKAVQETRRINNFNMANIIEDRARRTTARANINRIV